MWRRSLGRAAQDSEENGAGPWGERPPVLFPSTVRRRSPTQVVQVSQLSGAGPIFPIGPAPLESTEATFAVQAPSIKTDLRQGAIGPAPAMEGRTSCNGGTCAMREGRSRGATAQRTAERRAAAERVAAPAPEDRGRTKAMEGPAPYGSAAALRASGLGRSTQERRPAEASGLGAYTGTEGSGGLQHRGPRRPLRAAEGRYSRTRMKWE